MPGVPCPVPVETRKAPGDVFFPPLASERPSLSNLVLRALAKVCSALHTRVSTSSRAL